MYRLNMNITQPYGFDTKRGRNQRYLEVSSRNGGIDGEMVRVSEQSNKHTYLKLQNIQRS
jgi:hypothetical protein